MPRRPKRPCWRSDCPNLNCTEHKRPARQQGGTRASAARRGYDRKWRRVRAAYLKRHPWCVVCGEPATNVDHIVARVDGGSDKWDNLQSLCHSDHSRKTAISDGGFGNKRGGGM